MSWKEKTVEQSREEFVLAALCGEDRISELCRKAGISRPTAYKWMRRYQAGSRCRTGAIPRVAIPTGRRRRQRR